MSLPGPAGGAAVVIDTNIVLDLLVFDDPAQAPLAAALAAGRSRWIATPAMRDELVRVLGYPLIVKQLAIRAREAGEVLAAFDAAARTVEGPAACTACTCSDPDDQIFIDLAVAHGARLVSKDRALLSLRGRLEALGVAVSSG